MILKRIAACFIACAALAPTVAGAQTLGELSDTNAEVADRLLEGVEIAEASGDPAAIVAAYAALRAFVPDDPYVALGYGIALVGAGQDAEADEVLASIIDAPPEVVENVTLWRADIAARRASSPAFAEALSEAARCVADARVEGITTLAAMPREPGIVDDSVALAPVAPPATLVEPRGPRPAWVAATASAGVLTGIFGVLSYTAYQRSQDHALTRQEGDAYYEDAEDFALWTNVALGTTIALAGVTLFTWRRGGDTVIEASATPSGLQVTGVW